MLDEAVLRTISTCQNLSPNQSCQLAAKEIKLSCVEMTGIEKATTSTFAAVDVEQ